MTPALPPRKDREMSMTWEQKMAACCALADTSLRMRKPGDWYVSSSVEVIEVGRPAMLVGRYGNGASPQEAVEDHWAQITAPDVEAVVVNAMSEDRRREVVWADFMWRDAVRASR